MTIFNETANNGALANGNGIEHIICSPSVSSGCLDSGSSTSTVNYNPSVSSGDGFDGTALVTARYVEIGSSGAVNNSTASITANYSPPVSAGVACNGVPTVIYTPICALASGTATVVYTSICVVNGGAAIVAANYSPPSSGTCGAGGSANYYEVFTLFTEGGGGLFVDPIEALVIVYNPDDSGDIALGGEATIQCNYNPVATGGIEADNFPIDNATCSGVSFCGKVCTEESGCKTITARLSFWLPEWSKKKSNGAYLPAITTVTQDRFLPKAKKRQVNDVQLSKRKFSK